MNSGPIIKILFPKKTVAVYTFRQYNLYDLILHTLKVIQNSKLVLKKSGTPKTPCLKYGAKVTSFVIVINK